MMAECHSKRGEGRGSQQLIELLQAQKNGKQWNNSNICQATAVAVGVIVADK
jgi:hypothetical protein